MQQVNFLLILERFCVRNSGATAVVEGLGDHGCEYMTGGRVVVLGSTGRNFAAGMSGGVAYILDFHDDFKPQCNMELVGLERVHEDEEVAWLRALVDEHRARTGSRVADKCLKNWARVLPKFVKVIPHDYKAALEKAKLKSAPAKAPPVVSARTSKEPVIVDIEESILDESLAIKKDANEKIDQIRGFMKYQRQSDTYRNSRRRIKDWDEVNQRLTPKELKVQAARCMDCGVPFCQSDTGCPIGNIIPKWNELVFRNQWQEALERLLMTNNFRIFVANSSRIHWSRLSCSV